MRKKFVALSLSTLLICQSSVVYAGIPVFDGSNLAQNILSAVRALKSNLNEAKMIANQIKSLENDLKNLSKLDFNIIDDYSENLNRLFDQMGSVHGLMQDLGSLEARFEELYPEFNHYPGEIPYETQSEAMNRALDQSRDMMRGAAKTGAQVLENLPKTKAQLEELLVDSKNAVGILQATQAATQIEATISSNLMHLSAQLATFSEAHMSYMQKDNMKEALQLQRAAQVLEGKRPSTEPPVPLR